MSKFIRLNWSPQKQAKYSHSLYHMYNTIVNLKSHSQDLPEISIYESNQRWLKLKPPLCNHLGHLRQLTRHLGARPLYPHSTWLPFSYLGGFAFKTLFGLAWFETGSYCAALAVGSPTQRPACLCLTAFKT